MNRTPAFVKLVEVGPRDGLQNEKSLVPASVKVGLIERLQTAGLKHLEVTSFVSPKWVPQMADNTEVMSALTRRPDVVYSVLTPNWQGFEAALKTKPNEIVVFGSASEAFSQKNINCNVAESMARFAPVVHAALAEGIRVRGVISCCVGCPYEGDIAPERVAWVAQAMKNMGVQHLGIADTIGVGTPHKIQRAMGAALTHFALAEVSGHFHDTYGQALSNTLAALEMGIQQFDTAVGGLGGCPYAKGATGNVATEDVVYLLHGMGIDTGVNLEALIDAGAYIAAHLNRPTGSRVARALLAKREH